MSIPHKSAPCARFCANASTTSGGAPNCWPAFIPINWPTTRAPPKEPRGVRDCGEEQLLVAEDPPLRQIALKNDLAMIRHFDHQIFQLEEELQRQTKQVACREYALVQTVPGIGENLGLTILYEMGEVERFPTVKDFLSYCRLVKGTVASAGKIKRSEEHTSELQSRFGIS